MELYKKNSQWKVILITSAILILVLSFFYTNTVVKNIREEERRKAELWAGAIIEIGKSENHPSLTYLSNIIIGEKTIPAIIADKNGKILNTNNLNPNKEGEEEYLDRQLRLMSKAYDPIPVEAYGERQFLYRRDSNLLRALRLFPLFQLGLISIFISFGYFAVSSARRAEQNQVWVGMAKETAHQLGTPITSLVAWLEHLKIETADDEKVQGIVKEFRNDVMRLELIAERFSKIGSIPELKPTNIYTEVAKTFSYMKRLAPKRVNFNFNHETEASLTVKMNPPLFDWVIENLLKNALDAVEGEGEISAEVFEDKEFGYVDISDTGKGIPGSKIATVFKPGYTTKKRGWGLGLSLSKRIIENYHSGRIFVKESIVNKGTTFRIQLPKN